MINISQDKSGQYRDAHGLQQQADKLWCSNNSWLGLRGPMCFKKTFPTPLYPTTSSLGWQKAGYGFTLFPGSSLTLPSAAEIAIDWNSPLVNAPVSVSLLPLYPPVDLCCQQEWNPGWSSAGVTSASRFNMLEFMNDKILHQLRKAVTLFSVSVSPVAITVCYSYGRKDGPFQYEFHMICQLQNLEDCNRTGSWNIPMHLLLFSTFCLWHNELNKVPKSVKMGSSKEAPDSLTELRLFSFFTHRWTVCNSYTLAKEGNK